MICFEKPVEHEGKRPTDTILHQEAGQSENTFTVRIMGTVLLTPVQTSPGLPYIPVYKVYRGGKVVSNTL